MLVKWAPGVRFTNIKRLLQNAWMWLADALGSANEDQTFCSNLLLKAFSVSNVDSCIIALPHSAYFLEKFLILIMVP